MSKVIFPRFGQLSRRQSWLGLRRTGILPKLLSSQLAPAQPPANPRLRKCQDNQDHGIPVRLICRAAVPCCDCARKTRQETKRASNHGVCDRSVWREVRGQIACRHSDYNSISRRKGQQSVRYALTERWKDPQLVQNHIRNKREHDSCKHPGQQSE